MSTDWMYSWVVLAACTTLCVLTDGILKSFGLFYVEMLKEYEQSVSVTTLLSGLMNGVFCVSTLPVMMYINKFLGPRTIIVTGGLLAGVGYSISYFANNIHFLFFSLSILVGIGMALIYPTAFVVVGTHFTKRKAMANSIATSGCCIGGLLCPPLYEYLLETFGLHGALLLTGGVLLHNIPLGCLMKPLQKSNNLSFSSSGETEVCLKEDEINFTKENNGYSYAIKPIADSDELLQGIYSKELSLRQIHPYVNDTQRDLWGSAPVICNKSNNEKRHMVLSDRNLHLPKCAKDIEFLRSSIPAIFRNSSGNIAFGLATTNQSNFNKEEELSKGKCPDPCRSLLNPTFTLYIIANSLASIVGATFLSFLPLYAKEHNIDNHEIVILVSLTGAVDIISRIVCGIIVDKTHVKTYQMIAFSQAVCGIAYNCNQFMTTFSGLVIFCIIIGLLGGLQLALMYPSITDIVGQCPPALSICILFQLPAFIIGPFIFGVLRDHTGNYILSFHAIGCIAILAAGLLMLQPLCQKFHKKEATSEQFD